MLKTVSSITNAIGALNYKGTWNASTNTPTLASGVGTKGDYYVVSVAGSTTLDGISNWGVGDWAAFNGSVWQRVEGGADLNGVNLSYTGTFTGGTGVVDIGSGQVYKDASGNVAIGNTSPTSYFSDADNLVVGTTSGNNGITILSGSTGTSVLAFGYTTGASAGSGSNRAKIWYDVISDTLRMSNGGTLMNSTQFTLSGAGIVTMGAYGAGAATFSAAGVISSVSDETWKVKDGVPTDADSMLKKLEPGYWYYNEEKAPIYGVERQLGFYAQNVNAAIGPEAAPTPETYLTKDENGNEISVSKPWGYYDRSVLAITVMSLKNALSTIEELKQRITALESK